MDQLITGAKHIETKWKASNNNNHINHNNHISHKDIMNHQILNAKMMEQLIRDAKLIETKWKTSETISIGDEFCTTIYFYIHFKFIIKNHFLFSIL